MLRVQAGFILPRISLTPDSANPEGCTSRFGWARRVSSGNVVCRAAPLPNQPFGNGLTGHCLDPIGPRLRFQFHGAKTHLPKLHQGGSGRWSSPDPLSTVGTASQSGRSVNVLWEIIRERWRRTWSKQTRGRVVELRESSARFSAPARCPVPCPTNGMNCLFAPVAL